MWRRVYREAAGLFSILQAAGRCNREGKRPLKESVVSVFWPRGKIPGEIQREAMLYQETAERFCSPEAIRWYSDALHRLEMKLLGKNGLDAKGILFMIQKGFEGSMLPFPQVAKTFRFIEKKSSFIFIPWDHRAVQIRRELLAGKAGRRLFREAGRYLVGVHPHFFARMVQDGKIVKVGEDLAVTAAELDGIGGIYSRDTGLFEEGESQAARKVSNVLPIEKGV